MITKAKVIEVNNKYALVEAERKSACDGCHKNADGSACTVCSLMGPNKKITAKAQNKVGAVVGDVVEIESSNKRVMLYAIIVFLLPIALSVAAYFIAGGFGADEVWQIVSSVGAFMLSFLGIWAYSKFVIDKRYDVVIKKIINN